MLHQQITPIRLKLTNVFFLSRKVYNDRNSVSLRLGTTRLKEILAIRAAVIALP